MNKGFEIAGITVAPGEIKRIELPVAQLYTGSQMSIPVQIHHGKRAGPVLFVSAAIHGDELNGIEIIRKVMEQKSLSTIKGTLILVPMVNVFGVLNQSRYLPDRRDLNRSFPGSAKGSLAGRLANLFLKEVVNRADFGIDLHTGAIHRSNLPQIRANLDDPQTLEMAKAFSVPVLMNADIRDGSMRQAAFDTNTRVLLYEAGEALRFDEVSIKAGVRGVMDVMRHLGMIRKVKVRQQPEPFVARSSAWLRAPASGFVKMMKTLGDYVEKGDILAKIHDKFGEPTDSVIAIKEGVIIGQLNIPLVQEGEAMLHIASFKQSDEVADNVELMNEIFEGNE